MKLYDRVTILGGMTEFVGRTGTVIDIEAGRPKMHRVRLDEPLRSPRSGPLPMTSGKAGSCAGSATETRANKQMENLPRIELLKLVAIEANAKRDKDVLALAVRELEEIWRDDRAACRFYKMLERTAPAKGS
jgi:hypothetical protein